MSTQADWAHTYDDRGHGGVSAPPTGGFDTVYTDSLCRAGLSESHSMGARVRWLVLLLTAWVVVGASRYVSAAPSSPPTSTNASTKHGGTLPPTHVRPASSNLALARPSLLEKRDVPPFWFNRRYATHHTRSLAFPPLFFHRNPAPEHPDKFFHADLSLTFGWYARESQRRRWINPVGLFIGGFSARKTVWGAIPLLMGYKRVGEQFNFGQFPFVWWWGNKHVKNLLVTPFHYRQKAPDGLTGISGMIVWYGHRHLDDTDPTNDRKHLVVAPVFWRFRHGHRQFDISPLYWGGSHELRGVRHHTLFPFFHASTYEFGNRKELWTLFWLRRSDKARRHASWAIPPLLTFSRTTPDVTLTSATPLIWHRHDRLHDARTTIVGPLFRHVDPHQRNTVVAPLFYRFRDVERRGAMTLLAPVFLTRKTPEVTSVWTLLGGGSRRASKGAYFASVFPLASVFAKTEHGTVVNTVGGPAYWHVRRPNLAGGKGSEFRGIGPVYFGRHGERRHGGLAPVFAFGYGGGTRYAMVTPLLWSVSSRRSDGMVHTNLVGPLYVHTTPKGGHGGFAPLVFAGNDDRWRYGIVPWLLTGHVTDVRRGRSLTLSPLFVISRAPDHRSIGVLGLAWDVLRTPAGKPRQRHSIVFPLYYRRQVGDQVLTITPVGGGAHGNHRGLWFAGPVFHQKTRHRSTSGLFPIAFFDRRRAGTKLVQHDVVAPLFVRRRAEHDDLDMWTPLVWRTYVRADKPRRNLAIVPLYFRQRQPKGIDVDAGLGFFWSRDRTRHTSTLIVGPGFRRLSRTKLTAGILPLYWWSDSVSRRQLFALPIIIHQQDKAAGQHTTIAPPFWFDRQQANGRRQWTAFPFVVGGKRLHNFTRFSLVPPGYFDVLRIGKNVRFTGYVPLLFRYQKCGFLEGDDARCRYQLWGSIPVFLYGKDGFGRRTHAALGLYYFDRDAKGTKFYTLLAGVNYRPRERFGWYVFPIYHMTSRTHQRTVVFPLFYRRAHRLERISTTVVAPPLFIGRQNRDHGWWQSTLLVWNFHSKHKVTTAIVPPVFLHQHAYAQRRLTWLMPLFLRDNHIAEDKTWTMAFPGLYFQRRKGQDFDFVQFPLIWHIERGDKQGTFGAFVWWDIRKRDNVTQVVPGVFLRRVTAEHDTKVLGPGIAWWSKGRGRNDGDRSWRALFGAFGGGVENGQRYVALFGAKIPRSLSARSLSGGHRKPSPQTEK